MRAAAEKLRKQFDRSLEEARIHDRLRREAKWSEAIAVGDRAWRPLSGRSKAAKELRVQQQGGSWTLREPSDALSEPKKRAIAYIPQLKDGDFLVFSVTEISSRTLVR